MKPFAQQQLDIVFELLDGRLARYMAPPARLVVCGGAALIAVGLLRRTTTDVDIVALIDEQDKLTAPAPMPDALQRAAEEVAAALDLPKDWLNNAPSRDAGGLFQMGLPAGLRERLHRRKYGSHLTVYFIGRIDQIHFKLYAAVDRGGYHISDLQALRPSEREMEDAARWTLTHDVSEGFHMLLKQLLNDLGYGNVAESL